MRDLANVLEEVEVVRDAVVSPRWRSTPAGRCVFIAPRGTKVEVDPCSRSIRLCLLKTLRKTMRLLKKLYDCQ